MDRLNHEYIALLSGDGQPSEKFWELEKRIREDKKHPGVIVEMKRSAMLWDIIRLVGDEVITMDDLDGFSDDIIMRVNAFLNRDFMRK